jgi:hypothetical protein
MATEKLPSDEGNQQQPLAQILYSGWFESGQTAGRSLMVRSFQWSIASRTVRRCEVVNSSANHVQHDAVGSLESFRCDRECHSPPPV